MDIRYKAMVYTNFNLPITYRVTKVLGDTDYFDIKMRVASSI